MIVDSHFSCDGGQDGGQPYLPQGAKVEPNQVSPPLCTSLTPLQV